MTLVRRKISWQKMSARDSGPGFALGFILGAAIGVVLGFILAPQPGRETREMLKDKAARVSETVKDLTADRQKVYTETWKKRRTEPRVSNRYFEE